MNADIFKINDADNGSDELEATAYGNGEITITVEEPWSGSTETGFGSHCSIRIRKDQAKEFAAWLLAHS